MVNDQNSHERDFDVLLRMKTACLFVFVFLEGHLSFAENVVNCTVKVSGSFLLVFFYHVYFNN